VQAVLGGAHVVGDLLQHVADLRKDRRLEQRLGAALGELLDDELQAVGERCRLGLWLPGEKEFGDEGGAHVHYAFSAGPGGLDALKARLEERGIEHRGPEEHSGGDRSLYLEDPEGNVVEVWDFFERGRDVRDF
jgi:catechol 2,3-dioxygenase-like lactoylglutathione lyase family enzyme